MDRSAGPWNGSWTDIVKAEVGKRYSQLLVNTRKQIRVSQPQHPASLQKQTKHAEPQLRQHKLLIRLVCLVVCVLLVTLFNSYQLRGFDTTLEGRLIRPRPLHSHRIHAQAFAFLRMVQGTFQPRKLLEVTRPNCSSLCPAQYDPRDGYPDSAFDGNYSTLVAVSYYRDRADMLYEWQYEHDNASLFSRPDTLAVLKCLAPVPIVFIKADWFNVLRFMKREMQLLERGFILVTGGSDWSSPHFMTRSLLQDDRLVHWFTQNPSTVHTKLTGLPIGIKYSYQSNPLMEIRRKRGLETFSIQSYLNTTLERYRHGEGKLVALNFGTGRSQRSKLMDKFCSLSYAKCNLTTLHKDGQLDIQSQYDVLLDYPFWLSPRGNGLDCYRTNEALYLGRIPILESSTLDSVYQDLPVVIVKSYDEVTESFLIQQMKDMQRKKYNMDKLVPTYWWKLFEAKRSDRLRAQAIDTSRPSSRRRCWGNKNNGSKT